MKNSANYRLKLPDLINSNKLFDIIKSSRKLCVLFQFLELQKLSDDRLDELCEMYSKSNQNTQHYFDYLKCNLNLIKEMNSRKKNLQEMNDKQLNKMKDLESSFQNQLSEQQNKMKDLEALLQKQMNDSESKNSELQNQLSEQQNKMKDLESSFQKQLTDLEQRNDKLQNQLNDSTNLNNEQKSKIKDLENQITQLQKQLNKIFLIKGQIVASVENGLLINTEINLKEKGSTLDTTRSKVIISTSDAKCLGSEAYEKGEPITSLQMKTTFFCKAGKYYVRCIVFNSNGEPNEILSNAVTTSASSLTFSYNGKKTAKISLPQDKYKLEVWGAKGGDSTGNGQSGGRRGNLTVPGGLGGYSRGTLSLNKKETIYVFVGEEGRASNSSNGSTTKGGFPDGGGTQVSYCSGYHTVPGTGGGSTSIRIGSESNYTRVIVAGRGGGTSGDCFWASPGGFGGGLSGGHSYYCGSPQGQGAGTQTASTKSVSYSDNGDPDSFGLGASSKYKSGSHSGGGGGGGWYGGGGGHGGHNNCGSGGGGSGWTFTESSLKTF